MKIAVMGYGTIGSGVVELFEKNREVIAKRVGEPIDVKSVLDIREFEGDPIQSRIVHDYKQIAEDPEIAIVVETMGGVEPAFTFVRAMLEAGKGVATSNKALVADKGAELFEIAKEKNVSFLYEASVGGGIPILRPIYNALTGDVIEEISGILNGTTNYMLTKMSEDGSEYYDVLKDAQKKGYAEKDPTADVEGHDACRKIAILTSLVSGRTVDFKDIHTEGISKITAADIRYALAMGCRIKLIASSYAVGDSYRAMVAPYLVPKTHPLYQVNDAYNGIFVHGNMVGSTMFYGRGAGKLPTASAVAGDVIAMAKEPGKHIPMTWTKEKVKLADYREMENIFFVRTEMPITAVQEVFGPVSVIRVNDIDNELGFVTDRMTEAEFEDKSSELGGIHQVIRVK